MTEKYKNLTDEKFNSILCGVMNENPASSLLGIPGVYEIVSEHFNNAVLQEWEEEQALEEGGD